MKQITVKPVNGMQIPDPVRNDFIEAEGRKVELSPYWLRRLRDKDVIEVEDAPQEGQTAQA